MVKDKVNYRALGPRTALTKQPVSGRANDGGLRIGEMERDTLISHGMADFLRESMMERGDKSYLAICNNTGMISIYNPSKGVFMSPMADGPLKFVGSLENDELRLEHITKFGRKFSIVCIPYSFKLLIQELQTVNAQIRIITEDNIDQIESMSFSQNIQTLIDDKEATPKSLIRSIQERISKKQIERNDTPIDGYTPDQNKSPDYPNYSPNEMPVDENGRIVDTDWGDYNPNSPEFAKDSPEFAKDSPEAAGTTRNLPDTDWGDYNPYSPYVSPNAEDKDKLEGGGDTTYKIGDRVCMRKCKDKHVRRPWEITHMGNKFITVRALDNEELSELDQVNVVSRHDIFPESQANLYIPAAEPMRLDSGIPMSQNIPPNNSTQPVVIIAPKFFNGNGSDNSTSEQPIPAAETGYNGNMSMTEPSIVIKTEDNASTKANETVEGRAIDFSKGLVIKKQGA